LRRRREQEAQLEISSPYLAFAVLQIRKQFPPRQILIGWCKFSAPEGRSCVFWLTKLRSRGCLYNMAVPVLVVRHAGDVLLFLFSPLPPSTFRRPAGVQTPRCRLIGVAHSKHLATAPKTGRAGCGAPTAQPSPCRMIATVVSMTYLSIRVPCSCRPRLPPWSSASWEAATGCSTGSSTPESGAKRTRGSASQSFTRRCVGARVLL